MWGISKKGVLMNTKIYLSLCLSVSFVNCYATVTIPGNLDSIETIKSVISSYRAPFEKHTDVGLLMTDPRLSYNDVNKAKTAIEKLVLLSDNHWIALNKRELTKAKVIAQEINNILLLGKYGFQTVNLNSTEKDKFYGCKFRCIEQIEMSTRTAWNFDPVSFLGKSNQVEISKEFACMYDLAKNFTNTPLFFQYITDSMIKSGVSMEKKSRKLFAGILNPRMNFANSVINLIKDRYPENIDTIETALRVKSIGYLSYINHITNLMKNIPENSYKAVDRGQTSAGHRNTCMFNSVFYADLAQKNISSTKVGSLQKGIEYVNYLINNFGKFPLFANTAQKSDLSHIVNLMNQTMNNKSSDAVYSFTGEVENDQIIPGILSNCSCIEMQTHSLLMNLAVFPKNKVREARNSLFSHYGSGYFGSENFAISPVSCSYYHAQSFVKS